MNDLFFQKELNYYCDSGLIDEGLMSH